MPLWFQSRIGYRVQDAAGKWKTINEQFLHDGVSFTDVEAQVFNMLEGRITDFEIKAIALVKFENVYEPHVGGDFYKVTVLTENDSDDKKQITSHLVAAFEVADAEKRAEAYMKSWLTPHTITGVVKSPILGVWHPIAEDWQDDFKQRMLKLAEEGHESANSNQTTIFDKDGKPKMPTVESVSVQGKDGEWLDVTDVLMPRKGGRKATINGQAVRSPEEVDQAAQQLYDEFMAEADNSNPAD